MQVETSGLQFERIESGRLVDGTARPHAPRPTASKQAGASLASMPVLVAEILSAREIPAIEADWRLLESRTLEPNPFHASDFVLAACQHFREFAAPHFVAVWNHAASSQGRRLVGLLPFQKPRQSWAGTVLRGWSHPFIAFSAPLIDRADPDAVLTAALDHLDRQFPDMTAACLSGLAADGPIAAAFARVAVARDTNMSTLAQYERGALSTGHLKSAKHAARAKKLRQHRRRLSEIGALTLSVAATYADIRNAAENFLVLEAKGWKGIRGSALVQDPDTSNFVRTMLWSAARQDRVRIASLAIEGQTIASVIMLTAGDHGYLWKIAYDEAFAKFSPGVLLIEEFSQHILTENTLAVVDSCTEPGNVMIEGLWSGRIALCDLMIGLGEGRTPRFLASLARERLQRRMRDKVKSVYRRLRGHD